MNKIIITISVAFLVLIGAFQIKKYNDRQDKINEIYMAIEKQDNDYLDNEIKLSEEKVNKSLRILDSIKNLNK